MRRPASQGAVCARHPEVAAVDVCGRCGAFVCADCVEYLRDATPACEPCARLLDGARPTRRAWAGLALSALGLGGLALGFAWIAWLPWFWAPAVPLGLAGFVTSIREHRALRARQASAAAWRVVLAGRALGFLHTVLVVGLGLFASAD